MSRDVAQVALGAAFASWDELREAIGRKAPADITAWHAQSVADALKTYIAEVRARGEARTNG